MKRKIVIVFLSILVVVILAIIGLFAYLQISLFTVKPIIKSALSHELSTVTVGALEKEDLNQYSLTIPFKTVNDEITERFIQQEASNKRTVVSAQFDILNKQAFINYRNGNFYLPVYAKVLLETTPEGVQLSIIPLSYGNKKLDLPAFIDDLLDHDIFVEPIIMTINASDYFSHKYMNYVGSQLVATGLQASYIFDLPYLDELFQEIEQGLDNDVISVYSNGIETQQEALLWIDTYAQQPKVVLGKIFEDFKKQGPVIKDLLALLKPALLDQAYEKYPLIGTLIPRVLVDQTRIALNGSAVLKYGQQILAAYDDYVADKTIVYVNNQPFDNETLMGITMNTLNENESFDFPNGFLSQFKLTEKDNVVNVLYTTEEGVIILLMRDKYKLLTQAEYDEDYAKEINLEGVLTEDDQIYESIYFALFNLYQEDIFFRYLKDDGNEAFAIVSKVRDYQNFDVVALQRKEDNSFKVLDYGIVSVDTFHKKHPNFNLNLATRMFENTTLQLLNGKTKTNIFEGVIERGYADENEEIRYCSFDGNKYISIVLNSGEAYIYTIYRGSFLEELYPLKEALSTFDDIPPIILLQEIPNKNIIN